MPETRPPPPMATKIASIGPWCWRRISIAIVPWPAITSGSSNGCTKVRPRSRLELERVGVGVGVAVAVQHDLGAEGAHRVDLERGRGRRHHDERLQPSSRAASATPWAWLPAEAQITPRASASVEQVRHLVVGAAQLEAEHRLRVLALEQHAGCRAAPTGAARRRAPTRSRRRRRAPSGSSAGSRRGRACGRRAPSSAPACGGNSPCLVVSPSG